MNRHGRLHDKAAIVTGGGSGIGRATAILFAAEGAQVMVTDINSDTAAETVSEIVAQGGKAEFRQADAAKAEDAEETVRSTVATFGKLDVLFNNAGIAGDIDAGLHGSSEAEWDRVMDINFKSVFLACKYAIPVMQKNGGGSIVNTASIGGIRASGRRPAYFASKAGVILYSMSLAVAHGADNIRVNCVCPGGVDTGLTGDFHTLPDNSEEARQKLIDAYATQPIPRIAQPIEIARPVLFLASDDAAYVTGTSLVVDGGRTCKLA